MVAAKTAICSQPTCSCADISARAGRKQAAAKSSMSGRECERDSDERQHGQVKRRFPHRLAGVIG